MARRVSTVLLLLLAAAAAAGQRSFVDRNPALHRLNDRVITTAFTGRNEVVCTYCLFQVVAATYQLGNDVVKREIKDALGSQRPDRLSEKLLATAESRPTLNGTLRGYYQRGSMDACPTRIKRDQCASIASILRRRGNSTDFRDRLTAQNINMDVEHATGGEIRDLFTSIPADTQLVFASTLVFRDRWETRLNLVKGTFRPAGASRDVPVPTLFRETSLPLLDGSVDGVQGVSLPYRDPAIRLYCFMTTTDGDIRYLLNQEHYLNLTAAQERFTQVRLPKFDIVSKKYSYVDLVQLMGMREMFQGGLGPTDSLKVDQLVHKAVIQTDEHGTSAAGAAGVAIVPTSLGPRPFVITFNKPFVCSLVDVELDQPLFTAYIADPRSE